MDEKQYIKDRVDDQFNFFDKKSESSQNKYRTWRVILIILSVSIPFLTLLTDWNQQIRYAVAGAGVLIAAIEGFLGLYKFQEDWVNNRKAAESLKREKFLYLTKSGDYKGEGAFELFVSRIENILAQENKSWATYSDDPEGNS